MVNRLRGYLAKKSTIYGDDHNLRSCKNTTNTTRACGCNFFETEVSASRLVFPSERPKAVYLARWDVFSEALAASALQHFPLNGPLLLVEANHLPGIVAAEIIRLNPTGTPDSAQIVVVGMVGKGLLNDLRGLSFTVENIAGANVYETAALVAQKRGYPKNIQLVSSDPASGAALAASWSAHSGDPILLTEVNNIPPATKKAIVNTGKANIYILGGPEFISERVVNELRTLDINYVDRIAGEDIFETSVKFARYKSPVSQYGWNRNEREGHAFSFTTPEQWQCLVSATSLSHMGKHTPFLFVERDFVPQEILNYIESVNPKSMDKPPFMHGFLIGSHCLLSEHVQNVLHEALSIDMMDH